MGNCGTSCVRTWIIPFNLSSTNMSRGFTDYYRIINEERPPLTGAKSNRFAPNIHLHTFKPSAKPRRLQTWPLFGPRYFTAQTDFYDSITLRRTRCGTSQNTNAASHSQMVQGPNSCLLFHEERLSTQRRHCGRKTVKNKSV